MEVDRHDVVELDEDHSHWQGLLLAALNLIVCRHVTSYGCQVAYLQVTATRETASLCENVLCTERWNIISRSCISWGRPKREFF
jgi:hypothetical protein